METFTMSRKEAPRPGLVKAALSGRITNQEGAQALRLSVRQFQRLKARFQRRGLEGLTHGNRGRPSPRRLARGVCRRVARLLRTTYAGFNDSHFTEKLVEQEGIAIGRETVRRLRRALGIAPQRRRRAPQHRARRLREARPGALVLVDGSPFRWLGPAGPELTLVGAFDDAEGRILGLTLRPTEDLHGYAVVLRQMFLTYGLPARLYGDKTGVFHRNDSHWTLEEELGGRQDPTQMGQILQQLGIGYIAADSPQAKGRIERLWATLQGRLPQELRLRRIRTVAAALAFLPTFIADFHRRFAVTARDPQGAWRAAPRDLDRILACRYQRVVARDNTASIPGRWIQIPPGPHRRSYAGCRVELRELLDGRLLVFHDGRLLAQQSAPQAPFTLLPRLGATKRRAALSLDSQESRRKPERPGPRPKTQASPDLAARRRRPRPDNPWRRFHLHPDAQRALKGVTFSCGS
jgi:transposase